MHDGLNPAITVSPRCADILLSEGTKCSQLYTLLRYSSSEVSEKHISVNMLKYGDIVPSTELNDNIFWVVFGSVWYSQL